MPAGTNLRTVPGVPVQLTILGSGSGGNCAYLEVDETRLLIDAERQLGLRLDWRIFNTGASFEIGQIGVDTFTVPHDAQDPIGFLFRAVTKRAP
ncbi:MAG: hypothetical protein AB9869_12510 [Verrucomicrobiia bacterium]